MAGPTDLGGSPSTTVAIILAMSGLITGLGSAWLNRRPGKRRTEPAASNADEMPAGKRITAVEVTVADLVKRVTRVEIAFDVNNEDVDRRLVRLEDHP